ncbi:MAG TPA: hypothetical protein GXX36_07315 [Clostridiaceae bacterium]|nr:hypothetical protein [Clostridiaceae bacterium]
MSNTKSNKNSNPYFYSSKNIKPKNKGNSASTYTDNAQISKNILKNKKAELENISKENISNQTMVNPKTVADENSEFIEKPMYIESFGNAEILNSVINEVPEDTVTEDTVTEDIVTKESSEGIYAEATEASEEPHKKDPESEEKANKWFNPINDLVKLYISTIKKTRRGS